MLRNGANRSVYSLGITEWKCVQDTNAVPNLHTSSPTQDMAEAPCFCLNYDPARPVKASPSEQLHSSFSPRGLEVFHILLLRYGWAFVSSGNSRTRFSLYMLSLLHILSVSQAFDNMYNLCYEHGDFYPNRHNTS